MMRLFLKYSGIALLVQLLFEGFVFLTGFVFGHAIGFGVSYFLYIVPWMLVFPHGKMPVPNTPLGTLLGLWFLFAIPALIYSVIIGLALTLVKRFLLSRSPR